MWIPRWVLGVMAGLVVAIALFVLSGPILPLTLFECSNEVVERLVSPSGRYDAVLFVRNCGATTPFGTNVSLVDHNESIGDVAGDIFLASSTASTPQGRLGGPDVRIAWMAGDALTIQYPRDAVVSRQVVIERGFEVRYGQSD